MSRSSAAFPAPSTTRTVARHPENEALPDVIAFRPEASLLYINADAVLEAVLARLRAAGAAAIRLVVCDLSASPYIDLAGSRMLHELQAELDGPQHCLARRRRAR